jgi:hypothetical protein
VVCHSTSITRSNHSRSCRYSGCSRSSNC